MAKGKRRKHSQRIPKSGKNRSSISSHKQVGSELLPPFVAMGDQSNTVHSSWMDDRLPEMLWAALIAFSAERALALGQFRRILDFVAEHGQKQDLHDLTLTGIANLVDALRSELIRFIAKPPQVSQALSSLLLFDSLPGKKEWQEHLPEPKSSTETLMGSVGATLWHQSQMATDCRWVRLMAMILAGKVHPLPESADELFKYPNEYDERKVRPSVRAMEIACSPPEEQDLTWPQAFWHETWIKTPCFQVSSQYKQPHIDSNVNREHISELRETLESHWQGTHVTTTVDAKHDAIFGMALYCLRILEEMLGIGIGTSILGRLGLRTILEVRVNLGYLLRVDSPELWKKWRKYGAGQAKLNAIKFDFDLDPPKFIDIESIEHIASEDIWDEYLTVNLASWSGRDLRRMSERAGLKNSYDQHYSWTSAYSHGMWGAVRESCFQTCGNPLHRLHRYPQRMPLQDTIDDAVLLVDEIIQEVDMAYPTFERRLSSQIRS